MADAPKKSKSPATSPSPAPAPAPAEADAAIAAAESAVTQLNEMGAEVATAVKSGASTTPQSLQMPNFEGLLSPSQVHAMELLGDVHLNVKIELGRTRMLVEDVLRLSEGAVVELDKLAGDPVDVYVNDRHVARGEVLVLNDNFCVRVNEVLEPPTDGHDKSVA